MGRNITSLPPELLSHILASCADFTSSCRLILTCHSFHDVWHSRNKIIVRSILRAYVLCLPDVEDAANLVGGQKIIDPSGLSNVEQTKARLNHVVHTLIIAHEADALLERFCKDIATHSNPKFVRRQASSGNCHDDDQWSNPPSSEGTRPFIIVMTRAERERWLHAHYGLSLAMRRIVEKLQKHPMYHSTYRYQTGVLQETLLGFIKDINPRALLEWYTLAYYIFAYHCPSDYPENDFTKLPIASNLTKLTTKEFWRIVADIMRHKLSWHAKQVAHGQEACNFIVSNDFTAFQRFGTPFLDRFKDKNRAMFYGQWQSSILEVFCDTM